MSQQQKIEDAKAILGVGPKAREATNYSYRCGYAGKSFERIYGQTPEEALKEAGIEVPPN